MLKVGIWYELLKIETGYAAWLLGGVVRASDIRKVCNTKHNQTINTESLKLTAVLWATPKPGISSYDKPDVNLDGSIDVWFAPNAPEGKDNNRIKTITR